MTKTLSESYKSKSKIKETEQFIELIEKHINEMNLFQKYFGEKIQIKQLMLDNGYFPNLVDLDLSALKRRNLDFNGVTLSEDTKFSEETKQSSSFDGAIYYSNKPDKSPKKASIKTNELQNTH